MPVQSESGAAGAVLGQSKTNDPSHSYTDPVHQSDATHWDNLVLRFIEVATALGLATGATSGSLEEARKYGLIGAVTAGYSSAVGDVVRISSDSGGSPVATKALANASYVTDSPLYVIFSAAPGGSLSSGLILVRRSGLLVGVAVGGSPSVGAKVYLTDAGGLSTTPGTNSRLVGKIVAGAGPYDVWFDGAFAGVPVVTLQAAYDAGGGTVLLNPSQPTGTPYVLIDANGWVGITMALRGDGFLVAAPSGGDFAIVGNDTVGDTLDATNLAFQSGDGSGTRPTGDITLDVGTAGAGGFGQILIGATRQTNVWLGKSGASGSTTILSGDLAFFGVISPAAYGASQNDLAPTGVDHANLLRLSSSVNVDVTGISNANVNGRVLLVRNVGSFDITLKDQSGSSSAANRLALGGVDVVLKPGRGVWLIYDATLQRWALLQAPLTGSTSPVAVDAGSASAGTAGGMASAIDHKHSVSTGTPVEVKRANAAGSASTLAKSDHEHDGGKVVATQNNNGTTTLSDTIDRIDCNDHSGVCTINAHASPSTDREWPIYKRAHTDGTFGTAGISLVPNGAQKINGVNATLTLPGSTAAAAGMWLLRWHSLDGAGGATGEWTLVG